ncbi:MAG: 50S ribosomal protein L6 [Microgenomates bacterium OLB22]|nr:MAG: 50S ribosomal protein L6 [Microgenomates bacterium OLB22]
MSKIGQKQITIGDGVSVNMVDNTVSVVGQQGTLSFTLPRYISVTVSDGIVSVARSKEEKGVKALHGLYRSLIQNAVIGVKEYWKKNLEVVGTGYKARMQGQDLVFDVGYSHPVVFAKVDGVSYAVDNNRIVTVTGIDKQLVGEVAYKIRKIRKPDAYKGKGIRYEGEYIKLKPGKKAKTG